MMLSKIWVLFNMSIFGIYIYIYIYIYIFNSNSGFFHAVFTRKFPEQKSKPNPIIQLGSLDSLHRNSCSWCLEERQQNRCLVASYSSWWFFTNPSEKYARQIGSFPRIGVKIKNVWNHQLVLLYGGVSKLAVIWKICSSKLDHFSK